MYWGLEKFSCKNQFFSLKHAVRVVTQFDFDFVKLRWTYAPEISKAKKKNCCIEVTRPTLILPPTLDIFIYLFIFFEEKK